MPLSADSSLQTPCGLELSTPNPLPHTPVCHTCFHDTPFCPDLVRRIWVNTQRVLGLLGSEPNLWVGLDEKADAGRRVLVALGALFVRTPPPSSVLLPAPRELFAYRPGSRRRSPLLPFCSPSPRINLNPEMPYCPLWPLTVRPTHPPAF